MIYAEKCATCPTMLAYDALKFTCRSCMLDVCPTCAGMGHSDCDDPMPTTHCATCARDEAAAWERDP